MNIEAMRESIAQGDTESLSQRYALYRDLKAQGVMDIVIRDLLELELIRRGVLEDLGPYGTVNS